MTDRMLVTSEMRDFPTEMLDRALGAPIFKLAWDVQGRQAGMLLHEFSGWEGEQLLLTMQGKGGIVSFLLSFNEIIRLSEALSAWLSKVKQLEAEP